MASNQEKDRESANEGASSQEETALGVNLEEAKKALSKLPILGPVLWLYARDPARKFTFIGDVDWTVMPPVVLDQCRLYTKNGIPYAFVTWAKVSDAVDARLRSGQPKVAPHEWNSGPHVWLIDVVAPFGQTDATLKELRETVLSGVAVHALMPEVGRPEQLRVQEWPPATREDKTH